MNIVDALVVQLSMDTTRFKAGQAQANTSLKSLGDGASKTGADVAKVAQAMTNGFARVRTELLGLLGLFVAGKSIGGLTGQITQQDAALGRLSYRMGMSTGDLSAWQLAAQNAGGSAAGITASMTGLAGKFEAFKLTGQGGDTFIPWLSRLGVGLKSLDTGKLKTISELNLALADAYQRQDATDRKATDFYGAQLDQDQGTIDFLRHGRAYVQQHLDRQRAIGLPTPQDTQNAQQITEQIGYMQDRMATFGRHLLNDVSPGITRVLTRLGDWLDQRLPKWMAEIDPAIRDFMKVLHGLNFDEIEKEVRSFGQGVHEAFTAITKWKPPAWLAWMKRQVVGSPDAPSSTGAGNNAGRDGVGLPGRLVRQIGQGVGGQKAMDYFVAQGWTPEQAAGIAGNLQQESGFHANAGFNDDGTPGAHAGIAQWDKERREAIEAHFHKKLGDMNYDEQLQAVQYELTEGTYKSAGDKLRQEKTAEGSSSSVAHNYEIPVGGNDPDAPAKWAKEEAWRRQYAQQQMRDFPGVGKRPLDHNQSFADGFLHPPPELPPVPLIWAPPLPTEWRPVPPIPKLPEDGKNYPGDDAAEKPSPDGAERFIRTHGAAPELPAPKPPAPEHPVSPPIGAGSFLVMDAKRRWAVAHPSTTHNDNSSETHFHGPISVHTQAKDAHGIARDLHREMKARGKAAQANRGLS